MPVLRCIEMVSSATSPVTKIELCQHEAMISVAGLDLAAAWCKRFGVSSGFQCKSRGTEYKIVQYKDYWRCMKDQEILWHTGARRKSCRQQCLEHSAALQSRAEAPSTMYSACEWPCCKKLAVEEDDKVTLSSFIIVVLMLGSWSLDIRWSKTCWQTIATCLYCLYS